MIIEKWLIMSKGGSVRMVAKRPSLRHSEVPIHLRIEIPGALFERPVVHAHVTVPDEVTTPAEVSPEVVTRLEEAFETAGLRVELSVPGIEGGAS